MSDTTYHGRHEKPEPEVLNLQDVLEEGRAAVLAWEQSDPGSQREQSAAARIGECFSTIDAALREGHEFPRDWAENRPELMPKIPVRNGHQKLVVTLPQFPDQQATYTIREPDGTERPATAEEVKATNRFWQFMGEPWT